MTPAMGSFGARVTRRTCLLPPLIGLGLLSIQDRSWAGGQIEEPIADAVRNAMRASVHSDAPPEPVFSSTESRLHYLRWKIEMNKRLISRKTDLKTFLERDEFLQSVWYNCKRTRLDVDLVLGLIQVESNFRKRAISSVGARGYMQVMPFWMRLLGEGDVAKLFNMQTNLRFGCVILRHYLDRENGDPFMALGRYNGSRGKPQYPDAVFANKRLWEFVAK
jgi:soluble lytic murein transglycosylase-like protein